MKEDAIIPVAFLKERFKKEAYKTAYPNVLDASAKTNRIEWEGFMKKIIFALMIVALSNLFVLSANAEYVRGYYRSDGTYVEGYYRSDSYEPNLYVEDNQDNYNQEIIIYQKSGDKTYQRPVGALKDKEIIIYQKSGDKTYQRPVGALKDTNPFFN